MTRAAVATVSASRDAKLQRAVRAVGVRQRWQRALEAGVVLGAGTCAVLVARGLLAAPGSSLGALAWSLIAIVPIAGAAAWALRPLPILPIARAIDRSLETPDLIASALSFEALPPAEQTPFMRLCVAQAAQASERLVPSRALAFELPRALPVLCALALALLNLTHTQAREPVAALTAHAPIEAALDADTAAAFASELDAYKTQPLDPEAQELVAKLNALLEGMASGEIDRAEALAELRRIEERLQSLLANDPEALRDALEQLGRALAGTPEAKPLEKALREDWPEAANELKKLSERVDAKQLKAEAEQRLAESLERAAGEQADAGKQAAIDQAKRELDRLLRNKDEQAASGEQQSERDERLLKRKQRELDQLQREEQQQQAAQRELDRLKRDLDAASNALKNQDQKSAAEKLQDAARELQRKAEKQRARSQAQRLSEQLAQLRAEIAQRRGDQGGESSSQSGDDGQPIPLSVQRFGRMASGKPSGNGQQGSGQQGGGQQGAAMQPGKGGQGQEQTGGGTAAQQLAELRQGGGANGEDAALLQQSMGANEQGQGDGAGLGGSPKDGPATAGSGQHVDTRIEGEKRGGPSRSEVIFESGQRGFAQDGYAKVHGDYARHAESVLEREHVPGGYRYYVRRYFQLIRPRESTEGAP